MKWPRAISMFLPLHSCAFLVNFAPKGKSKLPRNMAATADYILGIAVIGVADFPDQDRWLHLVAECGRFSPGQPLG